MSNFFEDIAVDLRRLKALDEKARAVIAAGRPHTYANNLHIPGVPCQCPQCAAWDALKALLEEKS